MAMNKPNNMSKFADNALYLLKPFLVTTAVILSAVQTKKLVTGNQISDVRPILIGGYKGAIINNKDTLWEKKPISLGLK